MIIFNIFQLLFLKNMESLSKGNRYSLQLVLCLFWLNPPHWFCKFLLFESTDSSGEIFLIVAFCLLFLPEPAVGFIFGLKSWKCSLFLSWSWNKEFLTSSPPSVWSSYSQFNIARIRNVTTPRLSQQYQICYKISNSFLWVLLWNVSLSKASFVSRNSIFLFVLHILINDFFCPSHRQMYKSSTSVIEVIQRKSSCSYLCLPNSVFNYFFCFLLLFWRALVAQKFLLHLFLLTNCLTHIL